MKSHLAIAGLVGATLASLTACGSGGSSTGVSVTPTIAPVADSPMELTTNGWNGVHLGDPIVAVAKSKGWHIDRPCGAVEVITTGTKDTLPEILANWTGTFGAIESITISDPHVLLASGIHVGSPIASVARYLPDAGRYSVTEAGSTWSYWTVPAAGGALWIRSDGKDRVGSMGLATAAALSDRVTTMGGCV